MKHRDVPVLSPCSSAAFSAQLHALLVLPPDPSCRQQILRELRQPEPWCGDQQKGMIQVTQVLVEVMGESWRIILITIEILIK
jgi:hypothetical protein